MLRIRRHLTGFAAVIALIGSYAPAAAQSDILLQVRSGSDGLPKDRLRVDSAGGVVALGELGFGIIPANGRGTRMMWHPNKGAFRVGGVDAAQWDELNIGYYSLANGSNVLVSGNFSIGSGYTNTVSGEYASGFGRHLTVSGFSGFAAGNTNSCSASGCVVLGSFSAAEGDHATGIGYRATATGDYSMAFGYRAATNGFTGAIVFSDAISTDSIEAQRNNEFVVRASGGFRFRTNATLTTGCNLPAGSGVFDCTSSRLMKENFAAVDGEDLLGRMRQVPVNSWNYIEEGDDVRHLGPFAEDFHAQFGLGVSDTSIGQLDIAGVTFAGVQALDTRSLDQAERIEKLETEIAELRALVQTLLEERTPR